MKSPLPIFPAFFPAFLIAAAFLSLGTPGCNQTGSDPGPSVAERGTVDSLKVWPASLRYARPGDSLTLRVLGLKKGVACAERLTELSWYFEQDTLGNENYRVLPPFHQRPATHNCPADPGIDTAVRRAFLTAIGKTLYLKASDGRVTDTVVFVTGQAFIHLINHVRASASDTISVRGRFVFRDSTAGHPRRTIHADSLGACEILQAAAFDRRGDTVAMRMYRILANALPDSVLPACAGVRADSVEVVPNLHGFP